MGVNSVTRVSGPPCHAGLNRIIRAPDEASREELRGGVPNGRESAEVLQLFDDSTGVAQAVGSRQGTSDRSAIWAS